jgi:murein DD-endopeptidase MepM/ murein hydrolase activator NlpD
MRPFARPCLSAALGALLALTFTPVTALADATSELAVALKKQQGLAITLQGAREGLKDLRAEVDGIVARASSDDEVMRGLTRRDPTLLARLEETSSAVARLTERKTELDRRVRELQGLPFFVCPVDQPRRYIDDFGFMRSGGGGHAHQGIDIHASTGTPIRAPFDGRAEDASNSVGGLAVNVYGRTGFVYNAHLSGLGKLGPVREGDVIGYVGASGNAGGTAPHDHFEWHPGGGPAVDPFAALNAVC